MYTKYKTTVEKNNKKDYYYKYLENFENIKRGECMAVKYARRMDLFKKSELG